jgi:hypothetical protein
MQLQILYEVPETAITASELQIPAEILALQIQIPPEQVIRQEAMSL